jgi:hypothetical protein
VLPHPPTKSTVASQTEYLDVKNASAEAKGFMASFE